MKCPTCNGTGIVPAVRVVAVCVCGESAWVIEHGRVTVCGVCGESVEHAKYVEQATPETT